MVRAKQLVKGCANKEACPHLGFQACDEVLAENKRLKAQNADLRRIFDIATEAFKDKETEIQRLKRENGVLRRKLKDICQRPFVQTAGGEDAEETDNESAQQQQEPVRKKRGAPMGHRGATRKKPQRKPDRTVFVRPEQCPDCDSHDISPCQDVEEHTQEDIVIIRPIITRFIKQRGYCRKCGRLFFPKGPGERPKGYIGPVGVAVAGYLRYALKMPFESVAKIFKGFWGMDITPSALVGIDKNLTNKARPLYELIEDMTRYSNTINADETGWPVGAVNQWLSAYANVDFVLLKINPRRSGAVPQSVLGNNYGGVLGSDCFSAYNTVEAQAKQKCLTHYERGAKNLEKFYPEDQQALLFASCLKDIFKRARQSKRDWLDGKIANAQANQKAEDFEEELDQLVEPCVENEDAEKLRKTHLLQFIKCER